VGAAHVTRKEWTQINQLSEKIDTAVITPEERERENHSPTFVPPNQKNKTKQKIKSQNQ